MASYISAKNFIASPYGTDWKPGVVGGFFNDYNDVTNFLEYITALIDAYVGRSFFSTEYVETYFHKQGKSLILKNFPITAVSGIQYKTAFTTDALTTLSTTNYMWSSNGIVDFYDQLEYKYIYTVTYTAGYDEDNIPLAIQQATMMLANVYLQAIDSNAVGMPDGGGVTGFKFGKFQEQYVDWRQKNTNFTQGIPQTVYSILQKFKTLK